MDVDVILCIIWLVPFVLDTFIVMWNYGTKCIFGEDEQIYFRVYSIGGLILRIIISLIPVCNIFLFYWFGFIPRSLSYYEWYSIDTKELCKRLQLKEKLFELIHRHNRV